MSSERFTLMITLSHVYPGSDDRTDVYVEQSSAGADQCQITFCGNGMVQSTVTFLDAKALEALSAFLAEAAAVLRENVDDA